MKSFTDTFGELSATVHGVVVSSILLPGAVAALVAGILADRHGRTRLIIVGSCIYGIGAAIECGAPVLGVFILGRLIKGLGEGLFLSAVYVQVSEMSPARIRGIMTSVPQFLITTGLVSGYFICYGSAKIQNSSISWRLPLAIGSLLAFLFAAACTLVPPSPRWLLAQGQVDRARQVATQLGLDQAEQDELLSQSSAVLEYPPDRSFLQNLRETLRDFKAAFSAPFRSRTLFGCFIMGFQQFSGIDGVLYYAPILFQQAGLSSEQASFLASGVSALVILATTIPATLFADHWGRRTSSILGGSLITVLMLLIGSLYAAGQVHADSGAGRWVVVVSIYLFAIVFSATWAIGFRTFLVESMPGKTRSSASSLAQSANWVSLFPPRFLPPLPSPSLRPPLLGCACARTDGVKSKESPGALTAARARLGLPDCELHRRPHHAGLDLQVHLRGVLFLCVLDAPLHHRDRAVHVRDERPQPRSDRAAIPGAKVQSFWSVVCGSISPQKSSCSTRCKLMNVGRYIEKRRMRALGEGNLGKESFLRASSSDELPS